MGTRIESIFCCCVKIVCILVMLKSQLSEVVVLGGVGIKEGSTLMDGISALINGAPILWPPDAKS